MDVIKRNNVVITGRGQQPIVFAHGFGCDQQMWRFVAPEFEDTHRVVVFDHIGCGKSDLKAYDASHHSMLEGYAADVVEIIEAADLSDVIFVGHSVSAMIGILAANRVAHRFSKLVLICPSPRYLNDPPSYVGGFERSDVDDLIDMIETNMLGWANFLAPMVMGPQNDVELTRELKESFCAIDPYITRQFAAATFLADNRSDLGLVTIPSLIIQCSDDAIAPTAVGQYVHQHIKGSVLETLEATGHCPHMTHPQETLATLRAFLAR
jgi:sigma-B regulation protein RsbQ